MNKIFMNRQINESIESINKHIINIESLDYKHYKYDIEFEKYKKMYQDKHNEYKDLFIYKYKKDDW